MKRNFTATLKEGLPGQPCFVLIEHGRRHLKLEVADGYEAARGLAAHINDTVTHVQNGLQPLKREHPAEPAPKEPPVTCEEIEEYLNRTGMTGARLGLLALNDRGKVNEVRRGRRSLGGVRGPRLRRFMAEHPNGEDDPA